jgi:hypothetical protein
MYCVKEVTAAGLVVVMPELFLRGERVAAWKLIPKFSD